MKKYSRKLNKKRRKQRKSSRKTKKILNLNKTSRSSLTRKKISKRGRRKILKGGANGCSDSECIRNKLLNLEKSRFLCDTCETIEKKFKKYVNKGNDDNILNLLKKMPKGSLLHCHFSAMVSWRLLIETLLKEDIFNICVFHPTKSEQTFNMGDITFKIGDITVFNKSRDIPPEWKLVNTGNIDEICTKFSTADTWLKLEENTSATWSLIKRKGVFEIYFRLLLQECLNDGVTHIELKGNIGSLYDVEDTDEFKVNWLGGDKEIELIKYVYDSFENKDKITFCLIVGTHRFLSYDSMKKKLDEFYSLYEKYSDIIRGLDLFGEEIKGISNLEYYDLLKEFNGKVDKDFVFSIHSGETSEIFNPIDINLFTLIFFDNRVRIGHGLAIWKYPQLEEIIKKNNIHIELAPLSNKILGYTDNLKNHPGFRYYMDGISVSINPDDPSFFGYNYVTVDWLNVIKNWKLTLKDIFIICSESINFSAVSDIKRAEMKKNFIESFKKFLEIVKQTTNELL